MDKLLLKRNKVYMIELKVSVNNESIFINKSRGKLLILSLIPKCFSLSKNPKYKKYSFYYFLFI